MTEGMAELLKAGTPGHAPGITKLFARRAIAQLNGRADESEKGAGDRRSPP